VLPLALHGSCQYVPASKKFDVVDVLLLHRAYQPTEVLCRHSSAANKKGQVQWVFVARSQDGMVLEIVAKNC
jgi:hypothetical protein